MLIIQTATNNRAIAQILPFVIEDWNNLENFDIFNFDWTKEQDKVVYKLELSASSEVLDLLKWEYT